MEAGPEVELLVSSTSNSKRLVHLFGIKFRFALESSGGGRGVDLRVRLVGNRVELV